MYRRHSRRKAGLVDGVGFEALAHVVEAEVDGHESRTGLSLEIGDCFGELGLGRLVAVVRGGRVENGLHGVAGTTHLLEVESDSFQRFAKDEIVGVARVRALTIVAGDAGRLEAERL